MFSDRPRQLSDIWDKPYKYKKAYICGQEYSLWYHIKQHIITNAAEWTSFESQCMFLLTNKTLSLKFRLTIIHEINFQGSHQTTRDLMLENAPCLLPYYVNILGYTSCLQEVHRS